MATIKLFGKDVPLNDRYCNVKADPNLYKPCDKYLNLFIQLTDCCNAKCKFCEYNKGKVIEFDFDKFDKILKEISELKDCRIQKIALTGGEPTLNADRLDKVINLLRKYKLNERNTIIVLNTNGYNIKDIIKYKDVITHIDLSRHHYKDEINKEIFGTDNVASADDIKAVKDYFEFELRCNMISGYIDSVSEVKKYLKFANSLGVYDCAISSLMPLNNYCKEHYVKNKFNDTESFQMMERFHKYNGNKLTCSCYNYDYFDNNGEYVASCYIKSDICPSTNRSAVVFNGKDLTIGFGGEKIY